MNEPARNCGNCIFFIEWRPDPDAGSIGECRIGCWPSPLKAKACCGSFRQRGVDAAPFEGKGSRSRAQRSVASQTPIRRKAETAGPTIEEVDFDMHRGELKELLREVLDEELGLSLTPMGDRWVGGELVLRPGRSETQEKRLPLDAFFHKVIMLRDRLRVLEAKLNSHPGLSDADKVELQQYVTRCYGSLTTFNVLFRDKEDQFVGQRDKDD